MAAEHRRTVGLLGPRRFFWLLVTGFLAAGFAFGWFVADQRATLGLAVGLAIVAPLAALTVLTDRILIDERHERIAERAGAYTVVFVGGLGTLAMVAVGLGSQFGYVEITPQMVGFGLGIAVVVGVNVLFNLTLRYRS